MGQSRCPEFVEFRSLMVKIKAESALMKKVIQSKTEEQEESEILRDFSSVVETQALGTLYNHVIYQLNGWKELIDE